MISLVIVSHSEKLAEGVKELANQMVQGKVAIAAAGGIDDPQNPIGTDATRIHEAIESVYSPDGVLVMMDLGSAILSTEMALEFLSPEQQKHVHLCPAPIVEGTMMAAVQASVGGTIEQAMREAMSALAPKFEPDGADSHPAETTLPPQTPQGLSLSLPVKNKLGLHARPAARFVSVANQFKSEITVSTGNKAVTAKSINQVITLGVKQGDTITLTAAGPDAAEALQAFQALANDNFGDVDEATPQKPSNPVQPAAGSDLMGVPASPGIAIGPVVQFKPVLPPVTIHTVDDPAAEWKRLQAALAEAIEEIKQVEADAVKQIGAAEAAIFDAHRLVLQDPLLQDTVKDKIYTEKINAEAAWQQAIDATADTYRALESDYMRNRAVDVLDAGHRVLSQLTHAELPSLVFVQPSILVATDLAPSQTAQLDPAHILGICTAQGGPTAHSAILARALGIPAVVGIGPGIEALADGQTIALNGQTGQIWTTLSPEKLALLQAEQQEWQTAQMQTKSVGRQPAVTQDGKQFEVVANIGGPHDAVVSLDYGAEGVGLFRTEFLFMDRQSAPTEEEQTAVYRQVAETMGQYPVIIRTLDVGGDKPLPYLEMGREENPFLGWRGIRFCLDTPEIFKPQLRAILRAGAGHNFKIMFPMIGSLVELKAAKTILQEARAELAAEGLPYAASMEVGVMIEVPSAVVIADQLATEVDFFSIGTNDLTQYTMAADRGNRKVAELISALQPAVLRLIKQTVEQAHAHGVWVGVCGELAGNWQATPVLVGLGVDELSMSAPGIPAVKQAVRNLTLAQARQIAEKALSCESATAVQAYLASL